MRTRKRSRKGRGKKKVHFGTVTAHTGELRAGAEEAAAAVATRSKGIQVRFPEPGEIEENLARAQKETAKKTLMNVKDKTGKVATRAAKKYLQAIEDMNYAEARKKVPTKSKCAICGGRRKKRKSRRRKRRRKRRIKLRLGYCAYLVRNKQCEKRAVEGEHFCDKHGARCYNKGGVKKSCRVRWCWPQLYRKSRRRRRR